MKAILTTLLVTTPLSPSAIAVSTDTITSTKTITATEKTDAQIIEIIFKGSYKFWQQSRNANV